MNGRKVFVFLFISCLGDHFCTSQVYLPSILSAMDRTLQYYQDNYMRMNLDGVFGLRVLEGLYGCVLLLFCMPLCYAGFLV